MRKDISNVLLEKLANAKTKVVIASAFVKKDAFEKLAKQLSTHEVERSLITRWRKADLVEMASALTLYPLTKQYGWNMYLDQSLHAKIYQVDSWSLVGSANLTASGLFFDGGKYNQEACLSVEGNLETEILLSELIENAVEIDEELYHAIKLDVDSTPKCSVSAVGGYSQDVFALIAEKKIPRSIFTKDLLPSLIAK